MRFVLLSAALALGCSAKKSSSQPAREPAVALAPRVEAPVSELAAPCRSDAECADQGCVADDQEACDDHREVEATTKQDALSSALPVEGANVSIGSIAVDGLTATDLRCRRDGGGGLFGGAMGALSGISQRKGKLMTCAPAQQDVRVRWEADGGKIEQVEVDASSPEVAACVKKAVKGASAAFGGTCAATFSIGG